MNHAQARQEINQILNQLQAVSFDNVEAEIPEGSIVTTWVLMANWLDPNDETWTTRLTSSSGTHATVKGLLHIGLHEMD